MAAALARRIGAAFFALALLALLYGAWRLAAPVTWLRALLIAVVTLAALRPRDALLVLAGLGPIIGVYGATTGAPFSVREMVILASLAGWSLRVAAVRSRQPLLPSDLSWPVLAVTLVIVSSLAVELYGHRELVGPAMFGASVRQTLEDGLLLGRHRMRGLHGGLTHLEGLAIFAATVALCARRPAYAGQVAAMAAAGAAGAALLNIQRIVVAAHASAAPLERLRELLVTTRVNVSYLDVNAAGSYFALMFFPAGVQAFRFVSWRRVVWAGAAVAILAAAWLTGSRAAVAAILATTVLVTLVAARHRSWSRATLLAALVLCLIAAAAFVAAFPNKIFGAATPVAVEIRLQLAKVSLGLLAQQPLFGVGVGGFYDASAPLVEASTIAHHYSRENAHNNLLQWLAELGLIGFAAYAWLLWRAARRVTRAVFSPDGTVPGGLAAGLLAFTFTAMLGHPLLTPEVNHAFWLLLGIAAGAAPGVADRRASRPSRYATIAMMALVIGLLPWRFNNEVAGLPLEHVRYGVSRWETDPEGIRYQTFTGEATLFVPTSAQIVDIPFRVQEGRTPVVVEIRFRNRVADRVTLTPGTWHVYRLTIGSRADHHAYRRVDVRAIDGDAQQVWIGRTVAR